MGAARRERTALRRIALFVAVVLALALTVYPPLAVSGDGRAAHGALTLLLSGIAAGFVSGVGFVPRHRLPRVALGPAAALSLMTVGVLWLAAAAWRT
ncbi:MAG: cyd operon YbgE family protein [Burkholderiaceae bacterium]